MPRRIINRWGKEYVRYRITAEMIETAELRGHELHRVGHVLFCGISGPFAGYVCVNDCGFRVPLNPVDAPLVPRCLPINRG